jgi:hypothetical protein
LTNWVRDFRKRKAIGSLKVIKRRNEKERVRPTH